MESNGGDPDTLDPHESAELIQDDVKDMLDFANRVASSISITLKSILKVFIRSIKPLYH